MNLKSYTDFPFGIKIHKIFAAVNNSYLNNQRFEQVHKNVSLNKSIIISIVDCK